MKKIAVFPGSFDPFTKGHQAVIESILPLFDKIIIGIGINHEKNEYYSIEKRLNTIKNLYETNSAFIS